MSLFQFKLPDIGEGVSEGEVVAWQVEAGQEVDEDQPMVEVMTDKATVTIGAPKAGTIAKLCAGVGEVVQVGAVLVEIDTAGGAGADDAEEAEAASDGDDGEGPAATAVGDIKDNLPGSSFFSGGASAEEAEAGASGAAAAASSGGYFKEKPLATPATRKLARELEVDLRYVPPTHPSGRVTKDDVRAYHSRDTAPAVSPAVAPAAVSSAPTAAPAAALAASAPARAPMVIEAPSPETQSLEERQPFVGIRRKIAERMQRSKNTSAHFTFVEECDVGRLQELRARLKVRAEAEGVRLTFLPFIVKAVVAALKRHPILNAALDESKNELVLRKYFHIGIAASTDQGLMVPVLQHADRMSILEIAKEIQRLGEGARGGTLSSKELSGSTFTITSLGKQGGLFATPVLNFPEVGILGVHQIKQRPVVRDGEIVIGEIMLLSLSFDHRIVDGHVGAAFAYDIIGFLEDPDRLFLEMA